MKKVLLATTMLVAGASVAAAEGGVTLSGDARMGIVNPLGEAPTGFSSRARVAFALAGESDSGLSFGASFRADNADDAADGLAGSVFVSGAFGKLSMGDTDSAAKAAVGTVDGVGFTGLGDWNEADYIAGGGFDLFGAAPVDVTSGSSALYEYTAGSFSVFLSATDPAYTFELPVLPPVTLDGDSYAVGAKYATDAFSVSLGYETLDVGAAGVSVLDVDHLIIGATGTFGGVTVKADYGKADGTAGGAAVDFRQYSLSGTYTMDAVSVTAFASARDLTTGGVVDLDDQAIGLGASYDLGGGAAIKGGVVRLNDKVANTKSTGFDLGLTFKF